MRRTLPQCSACSHNVLVHLHNSQHTSTTQSTMLRSRTNRPGDLGAWHAQPPPHSPRTTS